MAWKWLDSKLGVGPGWGLTLLIATVCVVLQWVLFLLQMFCMPCIQTMFEALNL